MSTAFGLEAKVGELGSAPRFKVLSEEALTRLHRASLTILEEVGVRISTPAGRALLADAGCPLLADETFSIPAALVERALESAPREVVLHGRGGGERLVLGGRRCHVGTGVTCIGYLDPFDGSHRDFTLEDMALAARLGDALPNIDFVTTPGVVRETEAMPQGIVNQHEFYALVTSTTKPLIVLTADAEGAGDILEMAAVVAGGREALRERPFVVPYVNPVTPLVFNPETVDKLLLAADWGVPVVCHSAPQVGATSPVTLAGTAALVNAETLAGLVISQLRREGTPFLTGSVPLLMDMRTGNTSTGPETGLLMAAAAELAHGYGLPLVGIGALSDSKVPDGQAAAEMACNILAAMLAGVDLVYDAGVLECGLTYSPEAVVLADEVAGMCKRFLQGLAVDEESLALDVVRAVGIGGQFLGHGHTLEHFRSELWNPTLMNRQSRERWQQAGGTGTRDRARARVAEILETHVVEPLPDDVTAAMAEIIDTRRKSLAPSGAAH